MQPPERREQPPYQGAAGNPPRAPGAGRQPGPDPVSPDVLDQVRSLSDPYRRRDDYLVPPPQQRAPSVPGRAADAGLAALTHFAIAFGFVGIGFLLSVVFNIFIWLYSRRSPHVAFHAKQAGSYQCFVLLFNVFYVVLLLVLFGFQFFSLFQGILSGAPPVYDWNLGNVLFLILLVLGVLWFFFSILYGIFGGIMVLLGKDFRYPVFGRK